MHFTAAPRRLVGIFALWLVLVALASAADGGGGTGLRGFYFADTTFSNRVGERVDGPVDLHYPESGVQGAPIPEVGRGTEFSVWWKGQLEAPLSESYVLSVEADDGIQVFLDGKPIISRTYYGSAAVASAPVPLVAGHRYDLQVKFVQFVQGYQCRLSWESPSTPRQLIPRSQLYPEVVSPAVSGQGTGLQAVFNGSNNLTGAFLAGGVQVPDTMWSGSPLAGIPGSYWAVEYRGEVEGQYATTYTIEVAGSANHGWDYEVVWLDDRIAFLGLGYSSGSPLRFPASLAPGERHRIRVLYQHQGNEAGVHLRWSCPEMAGGLVPIPASQLYPSSPAAAVVPGGGRGLTLQVWPEAESPDAPVVVEDQVPFGSLTHGQSPAPGISATAAWLAEWSGSIEAPFTDDYTFLASSSNPLLVEVAGQVVLDDGRVNWQWAHGGGAPIRLEGGRRYPIRVRYSHQYQLQAPTFWVWWSSASMPTRALSADRLYPLTAEERTPLAITTPSSSRISPAWVEGTMPSRSASSPLPTGTGWRTGLGDGWWNGLIRAYPVVRESATRWYLGAPAGAVRGVPLLAEAPVPVEVTDGHRRARQAVTWQATDLGAEYESGALTLPAGSSLLLTDTSRGHRWSLSVVGEDGQVALAAEDRPRGARVPVRFPAAGVYRVTSRMDGRVTGTLEVRAQSVTFPSQACALFYQRKGSVTVASAAGQDEVFFVAADPSTLLVTDRPASPSTTMAPADPSLLLRPLAAEGVTVQARLGSPRGPVVAEGPIQVFTLTTSAEQTITTLEVYPDGSQLQTARLTMTPLVGDLTVALNIFVSGITFDDSTVNRWIGSSAFTSPGPGLPGTYDYRLIRAPNVVTGSCHSFAAYQDGIQVSY